LHILSEEKVGIEIAKESGDVEMMMRNGLDHLSSSLKMMIKLNK